MVKERKVFTMREEFKGYYFSHAINLIGSTFPNTNTRNALLRFINLDYNAQISVTRDKDRDSLGKYGFICSGDVIAAYNMDCLSRLQGNNRISRDKQCTIEEWNNAYTYPEAILTHAKIHCMWYRQEYRKDVPNQTILDVAKEYDYDIIIVPYSPIRKEEFIINNNCDYIQKLKTTV